MLYRGKTCTSNLKCMDMNTRLYLVSLPGSSIPLKAAVLDTLARSEFKEMSHGRLRKCCDVHFKYERYVLLQRGQ